MNYYANYMPKDRFLELLFMILGLVVTLPFILAYRAIKFLGE